LGASPVSNTITKPVIFLAFANDRDDTVGYLRNLPDEARRLRDVLQSAVDRGLCEVEVRSNSTAGDIFKVFQDPEFRDRIAIFHYSGHANGYQLLLESPEGKAAAADAGGLAAFLAQQQGLQLVFLNGCSTQQQTQELHDANVSVVISTSRSIDDKVATDFADLFYQGLAGGATLRKAYREASAAIKTTKGGDLRALYFGDADKPEDHRNESGFPWNLYPREGSENADQWNLPEAVGDTLFGLPPLPEQDLPESPYRHLNWFRREDAEVFFGRGHEIRKLYGLLTTGTQPIILFYGQSGVGKSSLLDAGLMPRLEQSCEVRYLRRRAGGLLDTLQLAFLPEASNVPIETAWLAKEEQLKKPLIVFLDQVEELYTKPIKDLPDELDQLLRMVKATFGDPKCRPKGKLVLGFRKEWLAELESQMVAYELPRATVFLERLDRRGIIEIVLGPARSERLRERYGLMFEDGLAEIIADDLLDDQGSAIAPTLQILLTKLWTRAREENYEHPRFSQELYRELKRSGILLDDFLDQQVAVFRERFPQNVDSGWLLDLLTLHTTALGTADQRTVDQLQRQYSHLGVAIRDLLQQCEDLYLLTIAVGTAKTSAQSTRLAHDTLAPLIRKRFEQSDRPGQLARRILDSRIQSVRDGKSAVALDERDLSIVEDGRQGMTDWTEREHQLVEQSRTARHKTRLARRRTMLITSGSLIVVLGVCLAVFILGMRTPPDAWMRTEISDEFVASAALVEDTQSRELVQVTTSYHEGSMDDDSGGTMHMIDLQLDLRGVLVGCRSRSINDGGDGASGSNDCQRYGHATDLTFAEAKPRIDMPRAENDDPVLASAKQAALRTVNTPEKPRSVSEVRAYRADENFILAFVKIMSDDGYIEFGSLPVRSEDGGATWETGALLEQISVPGISGFASASSSLFLTTVFNAIPGASDGRSGGVFRSDDRGITWQKIELPVPWEKWNSFSGVHASHGEPSTIGIALSPVSRSYGDLPPGVPGILVSHDGGKNWQLLDTGLEISTGSEIELVGISESGKAVVAAIKLPGETGRDSQNLRLLIYRKLSLLERLQGRFGAQF